MLFEQSHAVPILAVPSGGFEGVHAIGDTRDRVGVASGDRSCVCDRPDCFRFDHDHGHHNHNMVPMDELMKMQR